MKGRSALPRAAFLVASLAVVVGVAGSVWGRELLTRVSYFDVRQIEVIGASYIAPDSVLQIVAISAERSVWEDYDAEEARLVRHPLISEAQVRRSGRRSLRIVLREVEPIALVGLPELKAIREDGTVLPIDLASAALDLPLLTASARLREGMTRIEDGPALFALRAFARLHAVDPGLAAAISDFDLAGSEGWIANLMTSQPARRLALPSEIDEQTVRRVRATLTDLRRRGLDVAMVEARYADQVVVRRERI